MNEFVFRNLDSKKDIAIPVEKNIVYIYGGNGTGKTTFSKQFYEKVENTKVFNDDFINRNVYIVDTDGAKTDSTNQDNFSKLFVSEAVLNAEIMTKN